MPLEVPEALAAKVPEVIALSDLDSANIWLFGLNSLYFSSWINNAKVCAIDGNGFIINMLPRIIV